MYKGKKKQAWLHSLRINGVLKNEGEKRGKLIPPGVLKSLNQAGAGPIMLIFHKLNKLESGQTEVKVHTQ